MVYKEESLESVFPIREIGEDYTVSERGVVTFYYRMELPEMYSVKRDDYNSMFETLFSAFNGLEDEVNINVLFWNEQEYNNVDVYREKNQRTFVEKEYIAKFGERLANDNEIYLSVGIPFPQAESFRATQGTTVLARLKKIITDRSMRCWMSSTNCFHLLIWVT